MGWWPCCCGGLDCCDIDQMRVVITGVADADCTTTHDDAYNGTHDLTAGTTPTLPPSGTYNCFLGTSVTFPDTTQVCFFSSPGPYFCFNNGGSSLPNAIQVFVMADGTVKVHLADIHRTAGGPFGTSSASIAKFSGTVTDCCNYSSVTLSLDSDASPYQGCQTLTFASATVSLERTWSGSSWTCAGAACTYLAANPTLNGGDEGNTDCGVYHGTLVMSASAPELTISIYSDSAKTAKVAEYSGAYSLGSKTLSEQNSSGVSGTCSISSLPTTGTHNFTWTYN